MQDLRGYAAACARGRWAGTALGIRERLGTSSAMLIDRRNSAKSRPMASVMAKERTENTAATLGDVLYAKSKAVVPEEDWAALVRSIAAGDQLALHALYERAHRMVFTLAMRITANRETAEELTVDVFHDVWRRAAGYDAANGTVLGWIMNQARSRAIDRLRFENRRSAVTALTRLGRMMHYLTRR